MVNRTEASSPTSRVYPSGPRLTKAPDGEAAAPVDVVSLDAAPTEAAVARTVPAPRAATAPVAAAPTPDDSLGEMLDLVATRAPGNARVEALSRRMPSLPSEVRPAVGDALMDLLTGPDPQFETGLTTLARSVDWARRFKNEARDAVQQGGYSALAARAAEEADKPADDDPKARLVALKSSPHMLRFSDRVLSNPAQVREAVSLLDKFAAGHENPGKGSKSLGGQVRYMRGDTGVRVFYVLHDGEQRIIGLSNKSDEQATIDAVRQQYR
ncbi:MAG TPA: hypothetical protein VGO93_30880 [Candidatus Xenobia bacterium]|jgi:hypothetical protein